MLFLRSFLVGRSSVSVSRGRWRGVGNRHRHRGRAGRGLGGGLGRWRRGRWRWGDLGRGGRCDEFADQLGRHDHFGRLAYQAGLQGPDARHMQRHHGADDHGIAAHTARGGETIRVRHKKKGWAAPTQASTPFHQKIDMKSHLCPPCCVANPRDSYSYHCSLRLAWRTNASISFRQPFDETEYQADAAG